MPDAGRLFAYLCLATTMVTVAGTVVIGKVITEGMPPFIAAFLRFLIASIVLLPWALIALRGLPAMPRRDWGLLIVQSALGTVGFTVFLLFGLRYTLAVDAGVITGTLPAMVALLSVVVLRERLSRPMVLSILLATAGLIVLSTGKATGGGDEFAWWDRIIGNLLILGAIFGEACFSVLQKRLTTPLPPIGIAAAMCAFGLLLSLPFAAWEARDFDFGGVSSPVWWGIAYHAVVPTIIGYVLWYTGAARVTGMEVGIFTAVLPISAALLAYVFLAEPLTGRHMVAGAFVVAGIVVGAVKGRPKTRPVLS